DPEARPHPMKVTTRTIPPRMQHRKTLREKARRTAAMTQPQPNHQWQTEQWQTEQRQTERNPPQKTTMVRRPQRTPAAWRPAVTP
ncbi:hypothetical protein, partial [Nitrobacter sp.]|uniref:hypothetical protein n=1 Tax=Nitrobacter sp. TaxID=29420 RepID=UPI0032204689